MNVVGVDICSPNPEVGSVSFKVCPGAVYEVSLVAQRLDDRGQRHMSLTDIIMSFLDDTGGPIDSRLTCGQLMVPHLAPFRVETLPPCELTDALAAAALVRRFVIVPPDARCLSLRYPAGEVSILRPKCTRLSVLWGTREGKAFVSEIKSICARRAALLKRMFRLGRKSAAALEAVSKVPVRQLEVLMQLFARGGDWGPALKALNGFDDLEEYRARITRLRSRGSGLLTVGFIGSPRGYERLAGHCRVFWVREKAWEKQIKAISPDLVIIETVNASGQSADNLDWHMAFTNLDGSLPRRGKALLAFLQNLDIPVHLWATLSPLAALPWRGCAAKATRVIAEGGDSKVWEGLSPDPFIVPRGAEPAATSIASLRPRDPERLLIPVASDIFQYDSFADMLSLTTPYSPLYTEFRYNFNGRALAERLSSQSVNMISAPSRYQQRLLLQSAGLVLLRADSLRSDAELSAVAIDAIASGAIPVLEGEPRSEEPLLQQLDIVFGAVELAELQVAYKTHWLRERRWRELMRYVMRNCVWQSQHRAALFGKDPFPHNFDEPMVSAIFVTKRAHRLHECFSTFRRQTWKNRELIVIVNLDHMPEDVPELRSNEKIFLLPQDVNIGECLNFGIAYSTGFIWAKMDDDDFYSDEYLEDLQYYYRSTQADSVGRQSLYFYFAGSDETRHRAEMSSRCFMMMDQGFLSGATLSGDKRHLTIPFSHMDRNSADSNWVTELHEADKRIFSADSTGMVVYRDTNEENHTWKMGGGAARLKPCSSGNIFKRFEV